MPFGGCFLRKIDRGLVLLSVGEWVVVDVFIAGFPGWGRRKGLAVIASPRVGGLKRFAGDGRSGSIRGGGLAGIGVMTCTTRADRIPRSRNKRNDGPQPAQTLSGVDAVNTVNQML